jgi:hypothetical protein
MTEGSNKPDSDRSFSWKDPGRRSITYRNAEFPIGKMASIGLLTVSLMGMCAIGIHNRHEIFASKLFGTVTRSYLETATGWRSVNLTFTHGVVIVDSVDPFSDEFLVFIKRKKGGSADYPVRNGKASIPLAYGTNDNVITAMALAEEPVGNRKLVWTPVDFSDAMNLEGDEIINFSFTLSFPRP